VSSIVTTATAVSSATATKASGFHQTNSAAKVIYTTPLLTARINACPHQPFVEAERRSNMLTATSQMQGK